MTEHAMPGPSVPPVLAVTSGKGGVGKSNVVVNLAIAFARRGKRVTLFDADLGLANADILLGLEPRLTLRHVLFGPPGERHSIEDIMLEGPEGIRLVPASSGVRELTHLDEDQRARLFSSLARLALHTDLLLVDTAAGLSDTVVDLSAAADLTLVVTQPEPTAIVDAYALIKVLAARRFDLPLAVVVNMVADDEEGAAVFEQLDGVVRRFLERPLADAGSLPLDPALVEAVRRQRPLLPDAPDSPFARKVSRLAERLDEALGALPRGGLTRFAAQLTTTPERRRS